MKPRPILLYCVAIFILAACGSSDNKPGALESLGNLKDFADNIVEKTNNASAKWEERKAKGDTIAIAFKELEGYLPEAISGYEKPEGPKGSQMNTPGLGNWSQAEQKYTSGDNKWVTVSIIDYNAAQQTFLGLTALYGMGMSMEDDNKKQGPVDLGIKDVAAYETIYKKENRSELVLVVADRFIITMNSEGDNSGSLLPGVAKNMKLGEMVSR